MFNKRPKWIRSPRRLFGGLAAAGAALGIAAMVAGAALFGGEPPTAQAAPSATKASIAVTPTSLTIDEGSSQTVQVSLSKRPANQYNLVTPQVTSSLVYNGTYMVTTSGRYVVHA